MKRNELRKADLNLMVVFETLMQERNVSRAAEKLFVGQPSISSALNRLRDLFNDPLFIRVSNRMEPTARAIEILSHLAPALDALSVALSQTREFDPENSEITFQIGLSDDIESSLFPPLLKKIRQEAPKVIIVVKEINKSNVSQLLTSGDITAGVCITKALPPNTRRLKLRKVIPMVVRSDKPSQPLSLDEYCSRPHIVVNPVGGEPSFADEWLAAIGRKRRMALSIPQWSTLSSIMASTDLLCILPDYLLSAFGIRNQLFAEPLPHPIPTMELSMLWPQMLDADPSERWFRSKIVEFMGEESPDV